MFELAICTCPPREPRNYEHAESTFILIDEMGMRQFAMERLFQFENGPASRSQSFALEGKDDLYWLKSNGDVVRDEIDRVDEQKCNPGRNLFRAREGQIVVLTLRLVPLMVRAGNILQESRRFTVATAILRQIPEANSKVIINNVNPLFPRAARVAIKHVNYSSAGHLQLPYQNFFDRSGIHVQFVKQLVTEEEYWWDIKDLELEVHTVNVSEADEKEGKKIREDFLVRLRECETYK